MLAETVIELEARNPAAHCLRRWRVEVRPGPARDVDRSGRVPAGSGRTDVDYSTYLPDEPAAHVFVGRKLRRRATAPGRNRRDIIDGCARPLKRANGWIASVSTRRPRHPFNGLWSCARETRPSP